MMIRNSKSRARQFLAISDSNAFFVPEWKDPVCLRHLVALTGRECPSIVFVGAANGDSATKQALFYGLSPRVQFKPVILSLFAPTDDRWERYFAEADAIYVDGGSTRNLLALMREWKADLALRQAYERGAIIAGASAGANIMFEWGMTDSVRTRIEPLRGLGILEGSISVHHDAREERRAVFERHLATMEQDSPAYRLEDGTYLHFENEVLIDHHRC